MDELFNLTYKEEVEGLKDYDNFEQLGDTKYIYHVDFKARLYWAFCRPSGSSKVQVSDPHPLVSIMAFNHSRLGALKRFKLLNKDILQKPDLRKKISNRTRMLFRDLVDNDFTELNLVLKIVPMFLDVAIDQLIHGRKWNDISANLIEASKFLETIREYTEKIIEKDPKLAQAFYEKFPNIQEFTLEELKKYLVDREKEKQSIDPFFLCYIQKQTVIWCRENSLHILQQKVIEKLGKNLL